MPARKTTEVITPKETGGQKCKCIAIGNQQNNYARYILVKHNRSIIDNMASYYMQSGGKEMKLANWFLFKFIA